MKKKITKKKSSEYLEHEALEKLLIERELQYWESVKKFDEFLKSQKEVSLTFKREKLGD